jgi:hypothetical protein
MAHARRIQPNMAIVPTLVHSRKLNAQLADRRLGGSVLLDYLFDLFAASPFEVFDRLSVLSVLDQVKNDQALFPDGVSDCRLQ